MYKLKNVTITQYTILYEMVRASLLFWINWDKYFQALNYMFSSDLRGKMIQT